MANPVSIVQAIIDLALKIKNQVDTFRHNREDCRKIGELVATVRAVAEGLRKTTEKDGGALLGGALNALKQALERAWGLVVACQGKHAVLRALDAEGIAVKLRRVYLDVSLNLSAVVLANGAYNTSKLADINGVVAAQRADVAYNTSKLADINGVVAALRADVAYNTSMLEKILEIVAALPDALLHLQQQVGRLVQMCSDSTDDDASYYYYQNESTRETKKTDDVVRHSTYSSSYANERATTRTTKTQSSDSYQGAQHQSTVTCDQQLYGAAASMQRRPSSRDSYYYYLKEQWYWWSTDGWCKPDNGRSRYPKGVTVVILTMASFEYGLGHKAFLTEPPQDSSPDSVIEIKDMAEWQKHWDGAAKYNKLLVYEFYDKTTWTYMIMRYKNEVHPLFEKLAKHYKGKANFCKLDADNFEFLARLCGEGPYVMYPSFGLFKNCKLVGTVVGINWLELKQSIGRALD